MFVAWPAPSHYLNKCWNIVNWIQGDRFQWNFHQNKTIFIQENAFENVVWKSAAILFRPQCVNIGSDNGVAQIRWKAIIWANDDVVY